MLVKVLIRPSARATIRNGSRLRIARAAQPWHHRTIAGTQNGPRPPERSGPGPHEAEARSTPPPPRTHQVDSRVPRARSDQPRTRAGSPPWPVPASEQLATCVPLPASGLGPRRTAIPVRPCASSSSAIAMPGTLLVRTFLTRSRAGLRPAGCRRSGRASHRLRRLGLLRRPAGSGGPAAQGSRTPRSPSQSSRKDSRWAPRVSRPPSHIHRTCQPDSVLKVENYRDPGAQVSGTQRSSVLVTRVAPKKFKQCHGAA